MGRPDPARERIKTIRGKLKALTAPHTEGTRLASQADAHQLARDEIPWLLEQLEEALDDVEELQEELNHYRYY